MISDMLFIPTKTQDQPYTELEADLTPSRSPRFGRLITSLFFLLFSTNQIRLLQVEGLSKTTVPDPAVVPPFAVPVPWCNGKQVPASCSELRGFRKDTGSHGAKSDCYCRNRQRRKDGTRTCSRVILFSRDLVPASLRRCLVKASAADIKQPVKPGLPSNTLSELIKAQQPSL
jgi:hypothetical protein